MSFRKPKTVTELEAEGSSADPAAMPVAPLPPFARCQPGRHIPIADNSGRVISPRKHYGDGLDGQVECLACSRIIGRELSPGNIQWFREV